MAYVRSKPKAHGRGNQIEGRVTAGQRVVLIEDLISTGGSSLEAVAALREAGAEVQAVLAIFTYGLPAAREAFEAAHVRLHTLTSYEVLLQVAVEEGHVPSDALAVLQAWQDDPVAWSEAHV
jgi:orotate phosphoribosyltransferase